MSGELVESIPYNACSEILNKDDVSGRIVVAERGGCMFVDKVGPIFVSSAAMFLDKVGVMINTAYRDKPLIFIRIIPSSLSRLFLTLYQTRSMPLIMTSI